MPERRTCSPRVIAPSDSLFQLGDGCWSPYPGNETYHDREQAFARWTIVRRDIWALEHRFRVPGAARVYDDLTTEGSNLLWLTWRTPAKFNLQAILSALNSDRAAVEAFRAGDPEGASPISDYLDTLLADFDFVESEARRIGAVIQVVLFPGRPRITSSRRYSDPFLPPWEAAT